MCLSILHVETNPMWKIIKMSIWKEKQQNPLFFEKKKQKREKKERKKSLDQQEQILLVCRYIENVYGFDILGRLQYQI